MDRIKLRKLHGRAPLAKQWDNISSGLGLHLEARDVNNDVGVRHAKAYNPYSSIKLETIRKSIVGRAKREIIYWFINSSLKLFGI